MALSNEDKKDVSRAFGKKAASAVSTATRDRKYKGSSITEHSGATGKREYQTSDYNIGRRGTLKDVKREISLHTSKSKALKSKTSISLERQSAHNAMRDKGVAEHWMRKLKND